MTKAITIDEVLQGDALDMMDYLAQTNNADYNMRKVVEESLELGEAMMKYLNKHPNHPRRPSVQDILGEFADIVFRGTIALQHLYPGLDAEDIGGLLVTEIEKKTEKFKVHIQGGKYKNFL